MKRKAKHNHVPCSNVYFLIPYLSKIRMVCQYGINWIFGKIFSIFLFNAHFLHRVWVSRTSFISIVRSLINKNNIFLKMLNVRVRTSLKSSFGFKRKFELYTFFEYIRLSYSFLLFYFFFLYYQGVHWCTYARITTLMIKTFFYDFQKPKLLSECNKFHLVRTTSKSTIDKMEWMWLNHDLFAFFINFSLFLYNVRL